MKKGITLMALIFIALKGISQIDSTEKESPAADSSYHKNDTIRIGNILIVRSKDRRSGQTSVYRAKKKYKPTNLRTNWWIIDLGISQVNDKTDYAQSIARGYLPTGAN